MFTYLTEKMKETTMTTSFQPFFNEWVNINEKHYTTLFSTEEFSKLKADLTTLSFEIKKNLEKQFENRIESLPLVVKSEMDELYKTIHDLKKTVKTLENKLSTETTTTRTTTKKAATV
jgi:polyhydroxyalkanoate synthesis regulator phasin